MKKSRAYLRLMRPKIPNGAFFELNNAMRGTSKLLAMQRHATVHLNTFRYLQEAYPDELPEDEKILINNKLLNEYNHQYSYTKNEVHNRFPVLKYQVEVKLMDILKSHIQRKAVFHPTAQANKASLQKFLNCFHHPKVYISSNRSHLLRKAAKQLLYQVHLQGIKTIDKIEIDTGRLDKMCEQLGLDHDMADFSQWLINSYKNNTQGILLKKIHHLLYLEMMEHRIQALRYAWPDILIAPGYSYADI